MVLYYNGLEMIIEYFLNMVQFLSSAKTNHKILSQGIQTLLAFNPVSIAQDNSILCLLSSNKLASCNIVNI